MPLGTNHCRACLASGGLALGFGEHPLRGSAVAMIAQAGSFDWLFIDLEHGAMCGDDATRIAIAALASVPGIDGLMIGTSDLTASMGIASQIGHADVRAAYAKVAAACVQLGKIMGMGGVYDETVAPDCIRLGARFILSGSDHAFLKAGASQRAKFLRGLG